MPHTRQEASFITTVSSVKREIVQNEIIRARKKNGDRLPSVRDIAKKYRISPTTVMRIVAELTGEGILVPSEKRGLFVGTAENASRYVTPKDNIAVIVNAFGYYYDEVLSVIETEAEKRELRIIFQSTGWGYRDISPIIAELGGLSRTAGIIMRIPDGFTDVHAFNQSTAQGVPIVFIDSMLSGVNADSITVDNRAGARSAVEHLIGNGHTSIAFLREPMQVRSSIEAARHTGYLDALNAHGITADGLDIQLAEDGLSLTDTSLCSMIRARGITAFFCYNDLYARWLIDYCTAQGIRVPGDVSVVGFDNARIAQSAPAITTIDPHKAEMGRNAARLLFRRIDAPYEEHTPEHILLTPTVVIGRTVGRR